MLKHKKSHKIQIGKVKLLKSNSPVMIEDVLARDDINGIMKDLNDIKPDIKSLIAIWQDRDGTYHWEISEDSQISSLIWMLESVKLDLLNEDE